MMFVTDWEKSIPKPPKALLEKCFTVYSTESKPHIKKRWALKHCNSFVFMDVEWLVDGRGGTDTYIFYFGTEEDKLMFALKWK